MASTAPQLPAVLGAAGVGAAALWLGRSWDWRRAEPTTPLVPMAIEPALGRWVFPVPTVAGRLPEISDGWGSPRTDKKGKRLLHLGADIMFRRRSRMDLADAFRPGTPNGTAGYFMPDDVPALSASSGVVSFAANTPRGFTVKIKHPEGWTTYYTHLASLRVAAGQSIAAGQPIGIIGGDPLDRRHLKHLHFELWRDHQRTGATDPAPYLLAWARHTMEPTVALRNGRAGLAYRPVGARGERYPDWIQALRGKSGVYVIRERDDEGNPIVVYVGESHTDRLYETLTRHFQTWRRWKSYWKGQYTEGHDPGLTYDRERVEVAARVMSGPRAIAEEERLIRRLRPRDNLAGVPAVEEAPF